MTAQIERTLQQELMLRLKAMPLVALAVPNSVFIPARTPAEKMMAARIINQMKDHAGLTPGAPDLVIAANGRVLFVELKRDRSRDLLGRILPAGRLSEAQQLFQARCDAVAVPYVVSHSWDELRERLVEWGAT